MGYRDDNGYGQFQWEGRMVGAHELALTFSTGETRLPNLETCHSCHNPTCVNPEHLRFGTRQDNVNDAIAADRHARGSRHGHARLTESDVVVIRERAQAGAPNATLAEAFGITSSLVSMIVSGKRWTHAAGPIRSTHGNRKVAQWQ